jgi:hypothetical protein
MSPDGSFADYPERLKRPEAWIIPARIFVLGVVLNSFAEISSIHSASLSLSSDSGPL